MYGISPSWHLQRVAITKESCNDTRPLWSIAYTNGWSDSLVCGLVSKDAHEYIDAMSIKCLKVSNVIDGSKATHNTAMEGRYQIHGLEFIGDHGLLIAASDKPISFASSNDYISAPIYITGKGHIIGGFHITSDLYTKHSAISCSNGTLQLIGCDTHQGNFKWIREWVDICPVGIKESIFLTSNEILVMPTPYIEMPNTLYHLDLRQSKKSVLSLCSSKSTFSAIATTPGRPNQWVTGDDKGIVCLWDLRKLDLPCSRYSVSSEHPSIQSVLIHRDHVYTTTWHGQVLKSRFDIYRSNNAIPDQLEFIGDAFETIPSKPPILSDGNDFLILDPRKFISST
jgi:hypothetical protein